MRSIYILASSPTRLSLPTTGRFTTPLSTDGFSITRRRRPNVTVGYVRIRSSLHSDLTHQNTLLSNKMLWVGSSLSTTNAHVPQHRQSHQFWVVRAPTLPIDLTVICLRFRSASYEVHNISLHRKTQFPLLEHLHLSYFDTQPLFEHHFRHAAPGLTHLRLSRRKCYSQLEKPPPLGPIFYYR